MIYQIAGTILVSVCIICFTWYAVTVRRDAEKNRERVRKQREARNERVYNNGSMSLYEDERQRRIAAETKCGIYQQQIERTKKENERLKTMLAFAEDELRRA